MDFENTEIGFSVTGLKNYIDQLNMEVFADIKRAIENTTGLESAVERTWRGQSADNFLDNLFKGKDEVLTNIENVREIINVRLDSLQQQMLDMDANLVDFD